MKNARRAEEAGFSFALVEAIDRFIEAGYDHVYVHQVGPDQDVFFDLCERELVPRYSNVALARSADDGVVLVMSRLFYGWPGPGTHNDS